MAVAAGKHGAQQVSGPEEAGDQTPGHEENAEGQSFLQRRQGEVLGHRRCRIRLMKNIEHDYKENDPESEA